jgi:hypothetical protein
MIHAKRINISSAEATELFCVSLFLTKYRLTRSKYAAFVPKTKIKYIGKLSQRFLIFIYVLPVNKINH